MDNCRNDDRQPPSGGGTELARCFVPVDLYRTGHGVIIIPFALWCTHSLPVHVHKFSLDYGIALL